MLKKTGLFLLLPAAFTLLLALADASEARRFGGGRSFGGKGLFSNKRYAKPTAPRKDQSAQQSGKQGQNAQNKNAAAPRSRFGGFGGLLGGMLMGGLLGSMLFGGGFSGINLMDILIIGVVLLLLFKFLGARKRAAAGAGGPSRGSPFSVSAPTGPTGPTAPTGAGPLGGGFGPGGDLSQPAAEPVGPNVPPGFDEAEFLEGAKAVYVRLQEAWDRRDLDDIRDFAAQDVCEEIERQAKEDPKPGRTEILLLEARLLEFKTVGDHTRATVYFDALLREDQAADSSAQTREVWHFTRDESNPGANWRLEGIQQLET